MPQIADAIKSQGRREGKQSGYPTGMLSVFGNGAEASARHQPQPQGEGHDGYAADAAKPKGSEPQQALRQRSRILLVWRQ
jgi:hypothetical protein